MLLHWRLAVQIGAQEPQEGEEGRALLHYIGGPRIGQPCHSPGGFKTQAKPLEIVILKDPAKHRVGPAKRVAKDGEAAKPRSFAHPVAQA